MDDFLVRKEEILRSAKEREKKLREAQGLESEEEVESEVVKEVEEVEEKTEEVAEPQTEDPPVEEETSDDYTEEAPFPDDDVPDPLMYGQVAMDPPVTENPAKPKVEEVPVEREKPSKEVRPEDVKVVQPKPTVAKESDRKKVQNQEVLQKTQSTASTTPKRSVLKKDDKGKTTPKRGSASQNPKDYVTIKRLPKSLYLKCAEMFPTASQQNQVAAYLLHQSNADLNKRPEDSDVPEEVYDLVRDYIERFGESPITQEIKRMNDLMESLIKKVQHTHTNSVEANQLVQLGISYLIADRLGFRQESPSRPSEVNFLEANTQDVIKAFRSGRYLYGKNLK